MPSLGPSLTGDATSVIKPRTKSGYIEIATSHSYSVGLVDDYPVAWVSGEAGWFEITTPSSRYKANHDAILEAITLYYDVMMVYEGLKGSKSAQGRQKVFKRTDLNEIFYKVSPSAYPDVWHGIV